MATSVLTCTVITCVLVLTGGQQLLTDYSNISNTVANHVHHTCPIWMVFNGTVCQCKERNTKITEVIECRDEDSNKLSILACYCLSYHSSFNATVFGKCIYTCTDQQRFPSSSQIETCKKYNRRGEFCSKCQNGTGHPLYSYQLNCIPCNHSPITILKYLVLAYLPLTIFFLFVMVFRISANAEKLSGYILMSQIITTPAQLRYINSLRAGKKPIVFIRIAASAFAIWNLDFFRGLYEPFCYHESMSSLLIVSLDYLVALYPLCLIIVTYCIIYAYDRFPRLAQILQPALRIFLCMRRQWDIKKSLVDGFNTFLLLSYIKILNASFDLLIPSPLYNTTGKVLSKEYLYYNTSIRVFHGEHIVYGVLAIFMVLIFNVAPLFMFILYPCKCFQRLLNCLRCSARLQPLHIFMDSFTGCYRITPRDYRHFAAFGLLVRIGNLAILSFTQSRCYYAFGCALFIIMAGLVLIVKPFKSPTQNTIDSTLYLVFAFGYLGATAYALSPANTYNHVFSAFMILSVSLSITYPMAIIIHHVVCKPLIPKIRHFQHTKINSHTHTSDPDEELLQSCHERKDS